MIRAALFDFGGVILTSPFEAFARYEAERGLPPGFVRGLNARNPDTNAWSRLERGDVDFPEFCRLFEGEATEAGGEVDAAEVMALLAGEVRPAMVEAVRRCHERLHTALLTNNFVPPGGDEDGAPAPRDHGDVMSHFDVVVESSVVGVRKPDPRFYAMACEALGVEASECVFLDDLGINLKPARALGMTTVKVDDPDVAIAELERIVGFGLRPESPVA